MERKLVLNRAKAQALIDANQPLTADHLYELSAYQTLCLWYAAFYLAPGMHPDSEDSLGEFAPLAEVMIAMVEDRRIPNERFYPLDAQKAGITDSEVELVDELCDHCQEEFMDPINGDAAYDADGKLICICAECSETDFENCRAPECGAHHVRGVANCPVCGCSLAARKAAANQEEAVKKFVCPECKNESIMEIHCSVTAKCRIVGQKANGDYVYDGTNIDFGDFEVDSYECEKCGHELSREELEEVFG